MIRGEEQLPEINIDRRRMNAVGHAPIKHRGAAILARAKSRGYVAPPRRDLVKGR